LKPGSGIDVVLKKDQPGWEVVRPSDLAVLGNEMQVDYTSQPITLWKIAELNVRVLQVDHCSACRLSSKQQLTSTGGVSAHVEQSVSANRDQLAIVILNRELDIPQAAN
jgi:hypothetical protein